MQLRIEIFGTQARLVGERAILLEHEQPRLTCKELRKLLLASHPCLTDSLSNSRIAINHQFASEDQSVYEHDEIAVIGMVSGG